MIDRRADRRAYPDNRSRVAASALLGVAFAIGCTQLYWSNFIDEGDNLASGALIARGYVLYRDLFSHHFPFPYYWVALITRCGGESIFVWRLSLLLFQTAACATALWLTPFPFAVAISAVVWKTVGYLYHGNMLIYSSFDSAALLPVFAVTLGLAGRDIAARPAHVIAVGLFSAVAILSNPLSLYAVLLSLAAIAVSGGGPKRAAQAALLTVGLLSLGFSYLALNGAVGAFVDDVIHFNSEIYSKYTWVNPTPFAAIRGTALRLLDLFDPRWLKLPSVAHLFLEPDRSILTGFLYRTAFIIAALILLAQRKVVAALFVYMTAAILIGALGAEHFRSMPFVLTGLFAGAWLVTGEWQVRPRLHRLLLAPRALIGAGLAALFLFGIQGIFQNRHQLSYAANYGQYQQRAAMLRSLSCGRADVGLAYYPSDPLIHVFTKMPPASRYMFMLPWVAEVALPEVLQNLQSKPAVVYVDLDGQVWGRNNRDYMATLLDFLDQRYTKISPGLYRSKALEAWCPLAPVS